MWKGVRVGWHEQEQLRATVVTPDMLAHACNPNTQRLSRRVAESEARDPASKNVTKSTSGFGYGTVSVSVDHYSPHPTKEQKK